MDCDICHRGHDSKRLPFLCAVDARNRIYEGRVKNLQLLIQNEGLQDQIQELLADTNNKPIIDITGEQYAPDNGTNKILAAADKLRDEVNAARAEIEAKKADLARRKAELASFSPDDPDSRTTQQRELERSAQITTYRWASSTDEMARTRSFLCAEAAKLYGLRRVKKSNSSRYDYHLGRLPVMDLTEMNSLSPEVISTSLAHISHTLMLASHYLAIRLPAELTLPHRDYPRPTIFNLFSSYHHGDLVFPSPAASINPATETKLFDSFRASRPRPLFVDKTLPQLSKEDPVMYSFFLEGVALLAYDIAWLCCSQGLFAGDKTSFEDICNMGRNLYTLLISQQIQTSHQASANIINKVATRDGQQDGVIPQGMGPYSHGTTRNFLAGAEGTELIKSFKLPSPMKLADKLKKKLMGDAPAPDWEVLEDDAWKVEDGTGNAKSTPQQDPAAMTVPGGKESPRSGSHGWTKLKSR